MSKLRVGFSLHSITSLIPVPGFSLIAVMVAMTFLHQPAAGQDGIIATEDLLQEKKAVATPAETNNAELNADRIIHEGGGEVSKAFGDVEITYQGKTMTGDEGQVNHVTGDGYINGNVFFTDQRSHIIADRIKFNLKTDKETLYNAKGSTVNDFYFTGEKIERVEEDRYILSNGTCSTCPHSAKSWRFDADEVDLTVEGYAFMKGVTLRAADIPVMYLPYFIIPAKTKRATGFLTPYVVQSSKRGWMFTNSFFWAMNDNMDATITHEYMGDAGNKFDLEYRYILAPGTHGNLNTRYLKETDPDKPSDRNLWKVKYNHRHKLPMDIINMTRIDRESEDSIDREYNDDVSERTRRYSDSYTNFQKNWDTRNIRILARMRESTVPEEKSEFNTLPTIRFVNQSEQIWGSPVYGSLDSSYTGFSVKTLRGADTSTFDVNRLDIFPKLTLPIPIAPWLNITPSAGYRTTFYSNGIDDGEQIHENFSREYYTLGLALTGPKFFRIFDTSSENMPKLKHLIVPSVTWSYLPGLDYDGEDRQKIVKLDGIDNASPANVVTYQLINQLIGKQITVPEETRKIRKRIITPEGKPSFKDELQVARLEESQTKQLMRFRISQSYNIIEADRTENPEVEKKPFSPVVFDLDTKPFDWLMLNYETNYNVYTEIWEKSTAEIGFRYKNIFHFALDRTYQYPTTAWDTLYLEVGLPFIRSTIDYSLVYNEKTEETHDSIVRYIYHPGCWSFSLNWYQRKINTLQPSGEYKVEDETKFLFMISLSGIGDILGQGRVPIARRKL
jgi:LPS-assembly protein